MAESAGTDEVAREEWLGILLGSYDGGLLELELNVDGQHFFDNIDELLLGDTIQSVPLELPRQVHGTMPAKDETVDVGSTISSQQGSLVSFCALLDGAQTAASREHFEAMLGKHQSTTTPHSQTRKPRRRAKTTNTKSRNAPQTTMKLRSALRPQKVNRRLFQ